MKTLKAMFPLTLGNVDTLPSWAHSVLYGSLCQIEAINRSIEEDDASLLFRFEYIKQEPDGLAFELEPIITDGEYDDLFDAVGGILDQMENVVSCYFYLTGKEANVLH